MYVYLKSERNPDLFTVGFYKPDGEWEPESDHTDAEEAAERVAWLNGSGAPLPESIQQALNSGNGVYRP
jgi:hypothetical protein